MHVLGACEAAASMRENLHQMRAALAHRRRHGGPLEAALSSVQVSERAGPSPRELLERGGAWAATGPDGSAPGEVLDLGAVAFCGSWPGGTKPTAC